MDRLQTCDGRMLGRRLDYLKNNLGIVLHALQLYRVEVPVVQARNLHGAERYRVGVISGLASLQQEALHRHHPTTTNPTHIAWLIRDDSFLNQCRWSSREEEE